MKTTHRLLHGDARALRELPDESVDLIVTSPPYPMIEMWDGVFGAMNAEITSALERNEGLEAFELMHAELDAAWAECFRVLAKGGYACINIGDATRTIDGDFRLFSNHSRVIQSLSRIGFTSLPDILWRKPTNAPNKFLGSGMLPAGAYVTYEHEYILIFRKGSKRAFVAAEDKERRRRSAFFWEERNVWFSDVWTDLKGVPQTLHDPESRGRSGAFPLELPYRLIQMYSLIGDSVLDPFAGIGTTSLAAMISARNSIGIEIDPALAGELDASLDSVAELCRGKVEERWSRHEAFIDERLRRDLPPKHLNARSGLPVVTGQETELCLPLVSGVREAGDGLFEVEHVESGERRR